MIDNEKARKLGKNGSFLIQFAGKVLAAVSSFANFAVLHVKMCICINDCILLVRLCLPLSWIYFREDKDN